MAAQENNVARILICGSRDFTDYELLRRLVDYAISEAFIEGDIEIVSGHCRGVDALGEQYAKEKGYSLKVFPADWDKHGKSAGPIRNHQMVDYIDEVDKKMIIAIYDEAKSRGTQDTIRYARTKGIDIWHHHIEL